MSNLKSVKIEVRNQKEKVVNHATLAAGSFNIACIWVDLKNKLVRVMGSSDDNGLPGVCISTLDEPFIEIYFPEYVGWEVFAHTVGKYTLSICLTKKKVEKPKKIKVDSTDVRNALAWPFPVQKPVIQ